MTRMDEQDVRIARQVANFTGISIDNTADNLSVGISLKNSGSSPITVCLFPGSLESKEEILKVVGKQCDGIVTDIIANLAVECTTSMSFLHRFLENNPTALVEMQLSVDNESQLSHPITLTQASPFRTLGSQNITPKSKQRSGDANTKLVSIPFKTTQLDDQTQMFITIGAGRSVELTLFVGASFNRAASFARTAVALDA